MIAGRAAARGTRKADLRAAHKDKQREQQAQAKAWFDKFDLEGDGVLSRTELATLLKYTTGIDPSEQALNMALADARAADIKGGGEPKDGVSKKAATAVVTKFSGYIKEQKWLDTVFDTYDTNQSGQLEKGQLIELLRRVSPEVEVSDADEAYVLDMVDLSHTGTILRSEALAACATWKSELASGNVPSQKTSMCTVL